MKDESYYLINDHVDLADQDKAPGQKQNTSTDGKMDIYTKDKNRDLDNHLHKNEGYTDPEHKDSYPEDMHLNYGGDDYIEEVLHLNKTLSD